MIMNETVKLVLRELRTHNIRPKVETTKGSHMRILWSYNGKDYSVISANSPSDHRGALNLRALVRRKLKEAGVTNEAPQPVATNGKENKLLPRVEQLERDIDALLDLLAEKPTEGGIQNQEPVFRTFLEQKPSIKQVHSYLLLFLEYDRWLGLQEIIKRSGRQYHSVAATLSLLKRKGLVEHEGHKWRKKIKP